MATDRDFFEWLSESGCFLYRNGCYDVSVDDVWMAWQEHLDGRPEAFRELDLLTYSEWPSFSWDDRSHLSSDDIQLVRKMLAKGTIWANELPDPLIRKYERTIAYLKRRGTYPYRREKASLHISRPDVRKRIFDRDGNCCLRCGTPEELSIDHIVPVIAGGGDEDSNLQTLCRRCNSSKGGRQ